MRRARPWTAPRCESADSLVGQGSGVSASTTSARVLVSWQGRPPAGLVSLAQRDLRGVDVVLENVTYSAAEIVEPWEGSEQELARIAGVPVTVIVIRPDQAPQPLEGD